MKLQTIVLFFSFLSSISVNAQNMAEFTGGWEGKIENSKEFNLRVKIDNLGFENATFQISNGNEIINYPFRTNNSSQINIPFAENHFFEGVLSENGKEINGFIKSGLLLYHLNLIKSKNNSFIGVWNILMVDKLKSQNIYLSVENGSGDDYQAYPIFGDNRFTGTWAANFQKENDQISFVDYKTGLQFKGKLQPQKIQLEIYLGNVLVTQTDLKKSQSDWEVGEFTTNGKYEKSGTLRLPRMEELILKDSLPNTHSVVISMQGNLLYENYFAGYNANIPHDLRSASKSISSAIVGIAKDKSFFTSVDQSIFDFLPKEYQINKDSSKK